MSTTITPPEDFPLELLDTVLGLRMQESTVDELFDLKTVNSHAQRLFHRQTFWQTYFPTLTHQEAQYTIKRLAFEGENRLVLNLIRSPYGQTIDQNTILYALLYIAENGDNATAHLIQQEGQRLATIRPNNVLIGGLLFTDRLFEAIDALRETTKALKNNAQLIDDNIILIYDQFPLNYVIDYLIAQFTHEELVTLTRRSKISSLLSAVFFLAAITSTDDNRSIELLLSSALEQQDPVLLRILIEQLPLKLSEQLSDRLPLTMARNETFRSLRLTADEIVSIVESGSVENVSSSIREEILSSYSLYAFHDDPNRWANLIVGNVAVDRIERVLTAAILTTEQEGYTAATQTLLNTLNWIRRYYWNDED